MGYTFFNTKWCNGLKIVLSIFHGNQMDSLDDILRHMFSSLTISGLSYLENPFLAPFCLGACYQTTCILMTRVVPTAQCCGEK